MADWLAEVGGAEIPDSDELQSHLCAPGYGFDSNSRLLLEKKEDIRKRVGFSPDLGDGLALTIAETVRRGEPQLMPAATESEYDAMRH